jgi:tetratricopeptide (TPR) repeat protein
MAGRDSKEARTVLEHLLRREDLTYEEVAAEYERLALSLGERGVSISARHLRRLASGERTGMTPPTRRVLQAMFKIPANELLRPWSAGVGIPGGDGSRPSSAGAVQLLHMAAEESRAAAFGREIPIGSEAIDQMHDEVRELATLYPVRPLPTMLGRLVDTQSTILALLERRQTPANARSLYFLAAIVASLLAYASNDLARPELALAHARTAFRWAAYTDHHGLQVWVRALQSFICFWADRPREALRYAELGDPLADASSGSASAWLFAGQARAWSALGNADRARDLIDRAGAACEQAQPDDLDAIGGLCTFARPRYLYYAGRALASLPEESATAERLSAEAVRAYHDPGEPTWDIACEADARISLALARVSRGELDGAEEILAPVFALPEDDRIHDLLRTLQLVRRELDRFDLAESRDLQEKIVIFARYSLPASSH